MSLTFVVCLFVCCNEPVCCCVKYVGSFAVDDLCLDEQMVQLQARLQALSVSPARSLTFDEPGQTCESLEQTCGRRRPVSIRFSLRGLKIYDEDETVRPSGGVMQLRPCASP